MNRAFYEDRNAMDQLQGMKLDEKDIRSGKVLAGLLKKYCHYKLIFIRQKPDENMKAFHKKTMALLDDPNEENLFTATSNILLLLNNIGLPKNDKRIALPLIQKKNESSLNKREYSAWTAREVLTDNCERQSINPLDLIQVTQPYNKKEVGYLTKVFEVVEDELNRLEAK